MTGVLFLTLLIRRSKEKISLYTVMVPRLEVFVMSMTLFKQSIMFFFPLNILRSIVETQMNTRLKIALSVIKFLGSSSKISYLPIGKDDPKVRRPNLE